MKEMMQLDKREQVNPIVNFFFLGLLRLTKVKTEVSKR